MRKSSDVFRPDSGYRVFLLSMITFGLSYGLYKGVLDNYLAEIVAMSSFDKGVSEFFRELPGLMLVFVLALLYLSSAERIYRIGALTMLIGMVLHAVVPPGKVLVILAMFVFSLGDHIQLGMRSTLPLQYAREGSGGAALGLQNAMYRVGTLAGRAYACAAVRRRIRGFPRAGPRLDASSPREVRRRAARDERESERAAPGHGCAAGIGGRGAFRRHGGRRRRLAGRRSVHRRQGPARWPIADTSSLIDQER